MTPSDTSPILYASVAKGPTVLAELNAIDPGVGGATGDLSSLAAKCVEAAPLYHRLYTHTAGGRIYAFLMDPPLLFFAIADESLGRHKTLLFLRRLPDAISSALNRRRIDGASSLCYQDELLPVLRRLILPVPSHEDKPPPPPHTPQFSPPSDAPLTAETPSESEDGRRGRHKKGKKKKKMSDEAESRMEISVAADREDNAGMGMDMRGRKSLKQMWRRHVWMVLIFDLVVCCILFAIWLSVCKGFQCVAG